MTSGILVSSLVLRIIDKRYQCYELRFQFYNHKYLIISILHDWRIEIFIESYFYNS